MGELSPKEYKEYEEFKNADPKRCNRRTIDFKGLINFIGQISDFPPLNSLNSLYSLYSFPR